MPRGAAASTARMCGRARESLPARFRSGWNERRYLVTIGVISMRRGQRGFTRLELCAILLLVLLLSALAIPAVIDAWNRQARIRCVSHLKEIALAARVFASDHGGEYPSRVPPERGGALGLTNLEEVLVHYLAMKRELAVPVVLTCPADARRPAPDFTSLRASNLSYFIGLNAEISLPQMWLVGDRNLTVDGRPVAPGLFPLTTNLTMGWGNDLHRQMGNVAFSDGSVERTSSNRLCEAAAGQGVATNWLLVP